MDPPGESEGSWGCHLVHAVAAHSWGPTPLCVLGEFPGDPTVRLWDVSSIGLTAFGSY